MHVAKRNDVKNDRRTDGSKRVCAKTERIPFTRVSEPAAHGRETPVLCTARIHTPTNLAEETSLHRIFTMVNVSLAETQKTEKKLIEYTGISLVTALTDWHSL